MAQTQKDRRTWKQNPARNITVHTTRRDTTRHATTPNDTTPHDLTRHGTIRYDTTLTGKGEIEKRKRETKQNEKKLKEMIKLCDSPAGQQRRTANTVP